MMRKLATLTAAALLLAPAASHAQVVLGARLGYAVGMGDVGGDSGGTMKMSDWTKSHVPLQLEVLFKTIPQLAIGPYLSYGWAQAGGDLKSECDGAGVDCSASTLRLGVEAIFTVPLPGQFAPWVGAGVGYEWSKVHLSVPGASGDVKFSGFEFLNLQAGGDFKIAPRFRAGPFLQLNVVQYSNVDTTGDVSGPTDIPSKKFHDWFQLGVRGSFDL